MNNNNHFSRLNRFAIRPQLNFGFNNNDPGRKFNQIFNFVSEIHKSFPNIIDWVFPIHFRRFWFWHRYEHTLYIKARLFHSISLSFFIFFLSIATFPVATQNVKFSCCFTRHCFWHHSTTELRIVALNWTFQKHFNVRAYLFCFWKSILIYASRNFVIK